MSEVVLEKDKDIFQVILNQAVRFPGVRINRSVFLKTTLSKHFEEKVVSTAITGNPAKAGITNKDLDSIAKSWFVKLLEVIRDEKKQRCSIDK